jgi:YHS domain-containing protein
MKKLIVLVLLFVFMMPLAVSQVFAAEDTTQAGIVDAGNKMCPVSGEPVSGKNFVVYEGKRYGLCCPMCKKTFLSNPVQYVAKASASMTTATPVVSGSKEMESGMEQGDL